MTAALFTALFRLARTLGYADEALIIQHTDDAGTGAPGWVFCLGVSASEFEFAGGGATPDEAFRALVAAVRRAQQDQREAALARVACLASPDADTVIAAYLGGEVLS